MFFEKGWRYHGIEGGGGEDAFEDAERYGLSANEVRDEKYMSDEERNKKYAAKLSAESGLDFIPMFRFEALTVTVVRVGKDKLKIMLMRKTIGGADTMLHPY